MQQSLDLLLDTQCRGCSASHQPLPIFSLQGRASCSAVRAGVEQPSAWCVACSAQSVRTCPDPSTTTCFTAPTVVASSTLVSIHLHEGSTTFQHCAAAGRRELALLGSQAHASDHEPPLLGMPRLRSIIAIVITSLQRKGMYVWAAAFSFTC